MLHNVLEKQQMCFEVHHEFNSHENKFPMQLKEMKGKGIMKMKGSHMV